MNIGIILQGDYVKIKGIEKYEGFYGKVIAYNPIYEEYEIRLLKSRKVIKCASNKLEKVSKESVNNYKNINKASDNKIQNYTIERRKRESYDINMGYIINSDGKWFEQFKVEARNNGWVVHFQMSGKQPASVVDDGTILFHRIGKTNKILGYSEIEEVGYLTLDEAISRFGVQKMGYNSKNDLMDAASHWSTSFSHVIFYEMLVNLKLCNLDLNYDLIDGLNIHFGRPPSHLPTIGKILSPDETTNLLNYIINRPKTKL